MTLRRSYVRDSCQRWPRLPCMIRPGGQESLDGRGTKYETDISVHGGFSKYKPRVMGSIRNAVGKLTPLNGQRYRLEPSRIHTVPATPIMLVLDLRKHHTRSVVSDEPRPVSSGSISSWVGQLTMCQHAAGREQLRPERAPEKCSLGSQTYCCAISYSETYVAAMGISTGIRQDKTFGPLNHCRGRVITQVSISIWRH